jgi:hypothetical protein
VSIIAATNLPVIFAQLGSDGASGGTSFLNETTLGRVITGLLAAFGVIAVIFGLAKTFGNFASGKQSQAFKTLAATVVIAAFMFRPSLIVSLIEFMSNIFDALFGSAEQIRNNASTSGGGNPNGG